MSKDSLPGSPSPLLSVIIPAYNVESTLRRCVESVLLQGVESMEVIIVDDGSTDSTAEVAAGLGAASGKVRVISRQNGGLSAARNTGIEASRGGLLTFVDSDDWLLEGTYPPLLRLMDENRECDILEYSLMRHDGKRELSRMVFPNDRFTTSRDYWLRGKGYVHSYAWNKIYRRHVFFPEDGAGLRFREGRVFEDVAFIADLMHGDYTIITTPHMGYVYFYNPDGITCLAGAKENALLLDSLAEASKTLALTCLDVTDGRRKVEPEEEDFYMSVVNVQITECRLSGAPPRIPSRRVALRRSDLDSATRLLKKVILNIFGLSALCRLFSKVGRG